MARLGPERRLDLLRAASIIGFFLVWEWVCHLGVVTQFLLPAPSVVLRYLWDDLLSGGLLLNVRLTLGRMFTGYLLAAAVGIPLGICIARVALVRWFFDPLLSVALPMPQIAFLPIFILWLGVFDAAKIALIMFSSIFPIIVQAWAGTQSVDKFVAWSALSLGVGRRAFLWEIALPSAMPQILTGLQIALPIALIAATVVEMLMGGAGIGGAIVHGMRMSDSPELFAGIVAVGIMGFLLSKAMELLRRRVLAWHAESQAD